MAGTEVLLRALQHKYLAQDEFKDSWSDMLFSTSFLSPLLVNVREQMHRAFIFRKPGEKLEPIDADAAFEIVFRLVAAGPKYLGIQSREQAHVLVFRALMNEYVHPWHYDRKNSFATGRQGAIMVGPPPGFSNRRDMQFSGPKWAPVVTCDRGQSGQILQRQKDRLRAMGY
jgi:hypothetical protein